MQAHARGAVSTNTKQASGLRIALLVYQILPLQLAVPQTPPVNATLGSLGQMEAHARGAVLVHTRQALGPRAVMRAHPTLSPLPIVSTVLVMLVGRDRTVTVQRVCLANIKKALARMRARTV